ncbi:hypothetical protein ACTJKN_07665 [Pedobacter sp. 22163]|uniref:hypothetical protein n=1 Tax=Pedobacter sp. 22163 TaxID=3453883 RepID=UPI003F83410F
MRKYIFAIATAAMMASMGCHADRTENDRKSTSPDSSLQDSSRLDSFGGDGTAKSRKGTTTDSTVMGTPPD